MCDIWDIYIGYIGIKFNIYTSILGIYLTIISLLLIFDVFKLQTWLGYINTYYSEIMYNSEKYDGASNKAERQKRVEEYDNLKGEHPSVITYIIFGFIGMLTILGISLSCKIKEYINILFTAIPIGILTAAIILANIIFIKNGRNKLQKVKNKLDEMNK
ncbi:MAG: hypothetical protein ACFFDN_17155 [Candidatus Hodarchaeota archaeon]